MSESFYLYWHYPATYVAVGVFLDVAAWCCSGKVRTGLTAIVAPFCMSFVWPIMILVALSYFYYHEERRS